MASRPSIGLSVRRLSVCQLKMREVNVKVWVGLLGIALFIDS